MAKASIGEAYFEIGLDSRGLETGMARAENVAKTASRSIARGLSQVQTSSEFANVAIGGLTGGLAGLAATGVAFVINQITEEMKRQSEAAKRAAEGTSQFRAEIARLREASTIRSNDDPIERDYETARAGIREFYQARMKALGDAGANTRENVDELNRYVAELSEREDQKRSERRKKLYQDEAESRVRAEQGAERLSIRERAAAEIAAARSEYLTDEEKITEEYRKRLSLADEAAQSGQVGIAEMLRQSAELAKAAKETVESVKATMELAKEYTEAARELQRLQSRQTSGFGFGQLTLSNSTINALASAFASQMRR